MGSEMCIRDRLGTNWNPAVRSVGRRNIIDVMVEIAKIIGAFAGIAFAIVSPFSSSPTLPDKSHPFDNISLFEPDRLTFLFLTAPSAMAINSPTLPHPRPRKPMYLVLDRPHSGWFPTLLICRHHRCRSLTHRPSRSAAATHPAFQACRPVFQPQSTGCKGCKRRRGCTRTTTTGLA